MVAEKNYMFVGFVAHGYIMFWRKNNMKILKEFVCLYHWVSYYIMKAVARITNPRPVSSDRMKTKTPSYGVYGNNDHTRYMYESHTPSGLYHKYIPSGECDQVVSGVYHPSGTNFTLFHNDCGTPVRTDFRFTDGYWWCDACQRCVFLHECNGGNAFPYSEKSL